MSAQFALRHILAAMAVLAVVSWVAADAVRGRPWAAGVLLATLCLAFTLALYAGLFLLAQLFIPPETAHESDEDAAGSNGQLKAGSPFKSA